MKRHLSPLTLVFSVFVLADSPTGVWRATAADRDEAAVRLQQDLDDAHAEGVDLWIYNDIARAMEQGRRENKPVFVTFRCVPCTSCKAFDAEVAQGSESIHQMARENFICVRQVEMKGVDLSLFQFDHDLNWAAMFVNGDGTVYARYGTQSADGPDAYNSIEGLKNTMRRVLELHAGYPANAASLAGKRPTQVSVKSALELPGLEHRSSFAELTSRKNCIHCHMIHDAQHVQAERDGTFTQDMLWRYPLPDNIGLKIGPVSGIRIAEVVPGSPAAAAGLQRGEEVISMQGQTPTSIADMQWVLHHLPNTDTRLELHTSHTGRSTLNLAAGWKASDISWRGSLWSVSPKLRVWTPPLSDEERTRYQIPPEQGAFLVKWINTNSAGGRAAKDAGLQEGDIVVALNGETLPTQPNQLNLLIKLNYKIGDPLPLTVLRDGQRTPIEIKLAE